MRNNELVKKIKDNKKSVVVLSVVLLLLVIIGASKYVSGSFALENNGSIEGVSDDEVVYVIGEHLFTNDSSYISSEMMMYAARSISVPSSLSMKEGLNYMKVYMRDLEGNWVDALTGKIVKFEDININIKYKDLEKYQRTSANVTNLSEMEVALADENINTINIENDFETEKVIVIDKDVTINGKGHKIGFNKNSKGDYVFEIKGSKVVLNNLSLTGSNYAMLVNSANVSLKGNIDLSGNIKGGIRIIKESVEPKLDTNSATIINKSEEFLKPTIIEENINNSVSTKLEKVEKVSNGINHYYFTTSLKKEWTKVGDVITKNNVSLTIGDFVNYKVDGYDGKWKVIGVENDQILIMSEDNVGSNVSLTGKGDDFDTNAVNKLNNECAKYSNGKDSNKARSVTVEDLNALTGYDPIVFNYGKGTAWEYGNTVTYTISGSAYKKTSNYYSYTISDLTKIKKGDSVYELVFGKDGNASYWVASGFVRTFLNYYNEGIRAVEEGEVQRSYLRICEIICEEYTHSYGVRAVVYLNKDISFNKDNNSTISIEK